jgi:hypothetical protein
MVYPPKCKTKPSFRIRFGRRPHFLIFILIANTNGKRPFGNWAGCSQQHLLAGKARAWYCTRSLVQQQPLLHRHGSNNSLYYIGMGRYDNRAVMERKQLLRASLSHPPLETATVDAATWGASTPGASAFTESAEGIYDTGAVARAGFAANDPSAEVEASDLATQTSCSFAGAMPRVMFCTCLQYFHDHGEVQLGRVCRFCGSLYSAIKCASPHRNNCSRAHVPLLLICEAQSQNTT